MTSQSYTSAGAGGEVMPLHLGLTMSTLEIAGLCGKRHHHVLRDADKMLLELGLTATIFGCSYRDASGREVRSLNLPKRECLILVSGYSVELRARIIDRWMELEAALLSGSSTMELPADVMEYIRRTDGISRMLSHKVTEIEKALPTIVTQLLPAAVAGYIGERHLAIADGVTAGEVCDLSKVAPKYPKGISGRVSRRLTQFCHRNGEKPRVQRMGRVRAQLFPTHLVRDWLEIEGRALIKRWIEEKSGQTVLRLVPEK